MIPVTFNIKTSIPSEKVKSVFDQVAACRGVRLVKPLDPLSTVPEIQRMGFAYVDSEHDADAVVKAIEGLGAIDKAMQPAQRRLMNS